MKKKYFLNIELTKWIEIILENSYLDICQNCQLIFCIISENWLKSTKLTYFKWSTCFFLWETLLPATPGWNWQKIKQILSYTLRLIFAMENYSHSSCTLLPKNKKLEKNFLKILKNKQKNKFFSIHEIMRLIMIKMKMKMKNGSPRYNINRPRSRYGYKCIEYKKCLSMMMVICIEQPLSSISSSIH